MASKFITIDQAGIHRCGWCGDDPLYVDYHDKEWGRPVAEDRRLFEKLCLEGFQSGLSWITILRKRENFRTAFKNFEIAKVSRFTNRHVEKLLKDASIVRHRGKIEATINNAARASELIAETGSLATFFWQFESQKSGKFDVKRSVTEESIQMSRTLKKRGWKFVGPTTCYSFMQSMGIVNDHHPKCSCRDEIEVQRKTFARPPLLSSEGIRWTTEL